MTPGGWRSSSRSWIGRAVVVLAGAALLGMALRALPVFDEPTASGVAPRAPQPGLTSSAPRMGPFAIASEARRIMRARLSRGRTADVWVAPAKQGGYCVYVVRFGGTCDRFRSLDVAPFVMSRPEGGAGVVVAGGVLGSVANAVVFSVDGRPIARRRLTYVAAPVDAAFFVLDVSRRRLAGARSGTVRVFDRAGELVAARPVPLAGPPRR